jgi:spore coat protein CotH
LCVWWGGGGAPHKGGGPRGFGNDDANLSKGEQKRREIMEEWMEEGGFGENADQQQDQKRGLGGRNSVNTLKTRFFANEKFSAMYDAEYARLNEFVFGSDLVLEKINQLAEVFTAYNTEHNIMEQSEYDSGVERIKNYVTGKQGGAD